jgi:hypothetical protein
MKINILKSGKARNQPGRRGVLWFVLATLFTMIPGAAQLPVQKRITALQLGSAAEGSRVTIVSDVALNDYEAFRRGDRFYVKIPLAEFTSALPRLHADGFEDVQVQKYGDSVIVSFKLQPGASARVDQRANRLDVIFSAPNRVVRDNANLGGNGSRTAAGQAPDRVGPSPFDSDSTFSERFSGGPREFGTGRASRRGPANSVVTPDSRVTANNNNPSLPAAVASPSATSSYPPLSATTPSSAAEAKPSSSPVGISAWSRREVVRRWISANRAATLLGGLILLSLIAYALLALRQRAADRSQRANFPKVQPKVETANSDVKVAAAAPAAPSPTNTPTPASINRGLSQPNVSSPVKQELSSEAEEREVIEI